ncbi:MAG: phosphoribosylamine--glycine ligase [Muribaculaceae bacterium]|nr:phosphoribosylamine--glycine ligase [Muribaculaceae bacterium]
MSEKNSVLVIGSGGREHAIVDALARSNKVGKIYCAPGNAGIARQAECVNIKVEDVDALADFAKKNSIDLTVVGPEASLAAGVADVFHREGLKIFGPTKGAARIESSKEFAKQLMHKYHIPTGDYRTFTDFNEALAYVKERPLPAVIKYDGLAAGKGVVVAETYQEAEIALSDMLLDASFGVGKVIVEEFLEGPEFSFMCVVSGDRVYPLAIAQDHKRAFDGDKGPNTGGMGAYSPVPFISEDIRMDALRHIMIPAAEGLVAEGVPFVGVLYGGLILTKDGPKVIEFNARFGDPETEVVLPRLESDIYDLFESAVEGWDCATRWSKDACLGVVLAAKGYPGKYEKGTEIKGLDKVENRVYHMGTSDDAGRILTAGGRVLMVTGMGPDLQAAHAQAMKGVEAIECDNLFHRNDIGNQAL